MKQLLAELFELRGELSAKKRMTIEVIGVIFVVVSWKIVADAELISPYILPKPLNVLYAFGALFSKDELVNNIKFSLMLNFAGCLEAILISLPIGFILGLFPVFKAFSERYLSASRFLPLPAVLGIFIAGFGIYVNMKVQFLAVSIIVYLVPVVAQRVAETPQVYIDMAKTLGASKWQTIRWIFIPDVFSRVWVDIGVLSAISWTYITIAEKVNDNEGGLGALAEISRRQSRIDKVYAVIIIIMIIGWSWDKIHGLSDKMLFGFKRKGGK